MAMIMYTGLEASRVELSVCLSVSFKGMAVVKSFHECLKLCYVTTSHWTAHDHVESSEHTGETRLDESECPNLSQCTSSINLCSSRCEGY